MSQKFGKGRSVEIAYMSVPLKYTSIKHANNSDKELVLIDDFGKHYVAAYRNNKTCKIGIHFLLKRTENGFIFKGKEYKHNGSGWVF